jgi:RNA recognition motif-containing protein
MFIVVHAPGRFSAGETMGKRLYVGNLSYDATESSINELFSQFGSVESVKLITDRDTGRSKGFGFVEMGTEEAAQQAISELNQREIQGRRLTVNEARPQEPRGGGGFGGGGGGRGGYGGGRGRGRY